MSSSLSPRTPNRGVVNWRPQIGHIMWSLWATWSPLWWWLCINYSEAKCGMAFWPWWPAYAGVRVRHLSITKWAARIFWERFDLESPNFTQTLPYWTIWQDMTSLDASSRLQKMIGQKAHSVVTIFALSLLPVILLYYYVSSIRQGAVH